MGDNIHEPENNAEWLLSCGPLILKDALSLEPLASAIPTAMLFCVNLAAKVFTLTPIVPVVKSIILLDVEAGVIVTCNPVFENVPEPLAVPVISSAAIFTMVHIDDMPVRAEPSIAGKAPVS